MIPNEAYFRKKILVVYYEELMDNEGTEFRTFSPQEPKSIAESVKDTYMNL